MSLERMWDNKPVTKEGYAAAFAQVRDGEGSLDGNIVGNYMVNDPVNAVYLQTEAIKLVRETIIRNLNVPVMHGFQSPFVLWCNGNNDAVWIKRELVLPQIDYVMKSPTALRDQSNTYIKFHECLFCGDAGTLGVTVMSAHQEFKPLYGMFNSMHGPTLLDVQQFLARTRTDGVTISRISGLCRNCYKECLQCGAKMTMPRVTLETLDSYYNEGLCASCGGNTISKLPVPKPSRKDLKAYRVKFTSLYKGV